MTSPPPIVQRAAPNAALLRLLSTEKSNEKRAAGGGPFAMEAQCAYLLPERVWHVSAILRTLVTSICCTEPFSAEGPADIAPGSVSVVPVNSPKPSTRISLPTN